MGRCLAFNFGPEDLKQKLIGARFFVYTPDYDSAGYSSDQHFFAVLDVTKVDLDEVKRTLDLIALQGSTLRFAQAEDGRLFVHLESKESRGAMTDRQIADVLLVDAELRRMNLTAAPFIRNQDVVFGKQHLLVKELSQPFEHVGAFFVPKQAEWCIGKTYEEALANYDASERK